MKVKNSQRNFENAIVRLPFTRLRRELPQRWSLGGRGAACCRRNLLRIDGHKGERLFLNSCPLNVESSREASSGISRFFIIICAAAVCAAAFFLYCDAFFETVTFLFYISFKNILYFAFF